MEYKNWEKKWIFRAENAGYAPLLCLIPLTLLPNIFTVILMVLSFGFMIKFGGFGYSEVI